MDRRSPTFLLYTSGTRFSEISIDGNGFFLSEVWRRRATELYKHVKKEWANVGSLECRAVVASHHCLLYYGVTTSVNNLIVFKRPASAVFASSTTQRIPTVLIFQVSTFSS